MKREVSMSTNGISTLLNLDQELTPCEEPSLRILEVVLQAPEAGQAFHRSPLNVALVIDRSGSMSGDKLAFVKQAAGHVVEFLDETDRVALVDYDQDVRVLFPSLPLDRETRPAFLSKIDSIRSGGMTNLAGGWFAGCQQVAGAASSTSVNHVLLLTDGLANVGITDPSRLVNHARELARRGVTTSTFGVGLDFNHHLLEDMANKGEGRFSFIEAPYDIPRLFESEFKDLLTVYAHDLEMTLSYPPDLQVELLGEWSHDCPEPGKLRIFLGSLSAGSRREIFMKLSIPPGSEGAILPLTAGWRAKDQNGAIIESVSERSIRMVSKEQAEAAAKDEDLLQRYAQVDLGHRSTKALKMESEGKGKEAREILFQSLEIHDENITPAERSYYANLAERMDRGMDELDRKRSHHAAYAARQRRSTDQTYLLEPNSKGKLIFAVDGHLVLLDTGSPLSFGIRENWRFIGRHLRLRPDYRGVTPGHLAQDIGVPVMYVLGMDVLKDLHFKIDIHQGIILFSEVPFHPGKHFIQLEKSNGLLCVSLPMNGERRKLIVDTGANLHYLRQEALSGLDVLGREVDYHPHLGIIETEIYRLPVVIGAEQRNQRCGVLPLTMQQDFLPTNIAGVLGNELFQDYMATFNMPESSLFLDPVR
jgi:Ca-activated chloride channel homolog